MNKNDVSSTPQGTTQSSTQGLAQGVDEKLEAVKDTVKGLVDQGAQKVDALKTKVVEAKEQVITRGNDVLGRMAEVIKAHPLKAVGIAFGAGYLGMRLFRR